MSLKVVWYGAGQAGTFSDACPIKIETRANMKNKRETSSAGSQASGKCEQGSERAKETGAKGESM